MIGNLLGFMHAYNLRFGPATTPKQRQTYHQLFAILDQTRDQILAEAKLDSKTAARANPSNATDFFQKMDQGRSRAEDPIASTVAEPAMSLSGSVLPSIRGIARRRAMTTGRGSDEPSLVRSAHPSNRIKSPPPH